MKAVSAAVMRELDRKAIEEFGIPGLVLMENAGAGAFRYLRRALEPRTAGHHGAGGSAGKAVLVLCGGGNNGGDGYVIARHLANHGYEVEILAACEGEKLKGDARTNWEIAFAMGIPIRVLKDSDKPARAVTLKSRPVAVVDALLGTGASKELQGIYKSLVEYANGLDCFSLAVDIPTGVHADTGEILGTAFQADATATFGLPKVGLYLYPGAAFAGRIHPIDISVPASLFAKAPGVTLLGTRGALPPVPARARDAHKNRLGHLLVVAGSPGKGGAALMAGLAAMRAGVGLCTVATDQKCRASLEGRIPDLMVQGLNLDSGPGEEEEALVRGKTAMAVGPGIGTCAETFELVLFLLQETGTPLLVDADALTVFAGRTERLHRAGAPLVITPHPGEMARLTGMTVADVQKDRLGAASRLADKLDAAVVLKGAHTVIAAPGGAVALNLSGTPAMAKAGSGDVLTGIIGAYLAMGMGAYQAACLGTYVHGRCGEIVEETRGVHGVLASDLADAVPQAIKPLVTP